VSKWKIGQRVGVGLIAGERCGSDDRRSAWHQFCAR
jgi:hypothetical protein